MDSSSASTSASTTIILDLNDDCLIEIFKHLNLNDLCAVADVCRLFRRSSRTHFAYSAFKNVDICIANRSCFRNENSVRTFKILRIFGVVVKTIKMNGKHANFVKGKYEKKVLDLISFHCGRSLIELELVDCNLTYDVAVTLRFLFRHLQKLSLRDCQYSKLFGRMIPAWSPELRELHFSYESERVREKDGCAQKMPFDDILQRLFPNLTSISFRQIFNLKSTDLDEFLKQNPQLKYFGLIDCQNVDGRIFQLIAKHVPTIETIQIDTVKNVNDTHLKYFGKLKYLNTLKLCTFTCDTPMNGTFMLSILHEIHKAEIPLQDLQVLCLENITFQLTEQLIESISKLKVLKILRLGCIPKLNFSHILGICKQLKELSELHLLENGLKMSANELLEIIKYAEKLKLLRYSYIRADGVRSNQAYNIDVLAGILQSVLRDFDHADFQEHITKDNKISVVKTYMRKLESWKYADERSRVLIAYANKMESLHHDKLKKYSDVFLKIAQCIGHRRERLPLLIELNSKNSLKKLADVPNELKCSNALTVVVEDLKPLIESFFSV